MQCNLIFEWKVIINKGYAHDIEFICRNFIVYNNTILNWLITFCKKKKWFITIRV